MKRSTQILIISICILLTSCSHHRTTVRLKQINETKFIIYERENVKFYFPGDEFIKYCKAQDSSIHNNFIFRDALRYIYSFGNNQIIISDTLGMILEYEHFPKGDSLVYVRNQENINAYVTEAVRVALMNFATEGNLKVYDKRNKRFVDFIIIEIVDTKAYGETSILLPDRSVVYSQLDHIQ